MTRLDPVRRVYPERPPGKRRRDVDSAARVRLLQALTWGGGAGLLLGAAMGVAIADRTGVPVLVGILAGVLVLPPLIVGIALLVTALSGRAGSRLYAPSGGARRGRGELSRARALAAAGEYARAVEAFEKHVRDDPSDPEPYLALARVLRDDMADPSGALNWFRRALREARLEPGLEILVIREAVELIRGRGLDPTRAAPLLARLAERYPDRPEGRWAGEELERVKEGFGEGPGGSSPPR